MPPRAVWMVGGYPGCCIDGSLRSAASRVPVRLPPAEWGLKSTAAPAPDDPAVQTIKFRTHPILLRAQLLLFRMLKRRHRPEALHLGGFVLRFRGSLPHLIARWGPALMLSLISSPPSISRSLARSLSLSLTCGLALTPLLAVPCTSLPPPRSLARAHALARTLSSYFLTLTHAGAGSLPLSQYISRPKASVS